MKDCDRRTSEITLILPFGYNLTKTKSRDRVCDRSVGNMHRRDLADAQQRIPTAFDPR
jgi:hypothetical protein